MFAGAWGVGGDAEDIVRQNYIITDDNSRWRPKPPPLYSAAALAVRGKPVLLRGLEPPTY